MPNPNLHRSSGRWKLGLVLSLLAALNWGMLPIALKKVLEDMDPYTVTWYRFVVATVLLGLFIAWRRGLGDVKKLRGRTLILFVVTGLLLSVNYVLYVLGLEFLMPNTAQVVIQLAPLFLLFGSLLVFKEGFSLLQWIGLGIFISGLGFFFNERLGELLTSLSDYTVGVLLVVAAGFVWGIYGLAQKQLLRTFPPQTIMLFLFAACAVILLPFSHPGQILTQSKLQLSMLAFCALNSLLAYGCFVEALEHWQASRISAVLATTPLFTVAFITIGAPLFPEVITPDPLNALSLAGALLVVCGSMLTALGRKMKRPADLAAEQPTAEAEL